MSEDNQTVSIDSNNIEYQDLAEGCLDECKKALKNFSDILDDSLSRNRSVKLLSSRVPANMEEYTKTMMKKTMTMVGQVLVSQANKMKDDLFMSLNSEAFRILSNKVEKLEKGLHLDQSSSNDFKEVNKTHFLGKRTPNNAISEPELLSKRKRSGKYILNNLKDSDSEEQDDRLSSSLTLKTELDSRMKQYLRSDKHDHERKYDFVKSLSIRISKLMLNEIGPQESN